MGEGGQKCEILGKHAVQSGQTRSVWSAFWSKSCEFGRVWFVLIESALKAVQNDHFNSTAGSQRIQSRPLTRPERGVKCSKLGILPVLLAAMVCRRQTGPVTRAGDSSRIFQQKETRNPPVRPQCPAPRTAGPRMNEQIRISPIRLIGADGEQHGIVPTAQAMEMAREAGLDLVEVAATERPPVCKIMDYGKFKYAQSKKSAPEDAPAEAQGNPRPPQDRRSRHGNQDQPGPQVPGAQRQGAGQRAVPRPRDAAHRGRAAGHERRCSKPCTTSARSRIAAVDGRQADGRAAGPEGEWEPSQPRRSRAAPKPEPVPTVRRRRAGSTHRQRLEGARPALAAGSPQSVITERNAVGTRSDHRVPFVCIPHHRGAPSAIPRVSGRLQTRPFPCVGKLTLPRTE